MNCTAETNISLSQTIQHAITFFLLFAVIKVEYHTDLSKQSTQVNCCQGIIVSVTR